MSVRDKSLEKVQAVIELIAGGSSMVDALVQLQLSQKTFYKTLDSVPAMGQEYARARQMRADLLAEEIIHIADTDCDPQTARNRIDARRWYASKLNPTMYGDKIDLNVTQSVDITSALDAARARSALPTSYLKLNATAQLVDTLHDSTTAAAGELPVADAEALAKLLE